MVDACCYALRTGCAWRLLPKSFPPWQAVYMSFKHERCRRLIAHHDRSNWAPLAWVWLAEARILVTRLAT
jgi:transposase